MKALPTLAASGLLALATTLPGRAQPGGPPTAVNFASERGAPFGLVLDGQLLAAPVARALHVDYLAPGRHEAEFSVPTPAGVQRFRLAVWAEPGLETSFVLVERPGRPVQLRLVSKVPLLGRGRPAWAPGDDDGYDQGPAQGPGGNNGGYNPPAGPGGYPAPTSPNYPAPAAPDYPAPAAPAYPAPAYPAPAGPGYGSAAPADTYLQPMSPRDVAALNQALARRMTDDQRLDIVHQALEHNSLRAVELAAVVRTMTFDKSQQEVAEFGYPHVADPQNFYQVLDAFADPATAQQVQQELGLPHN